MKSRRIGISSSCIPNASVGTIVELAQSGLECVDLRAGRNHAWEAGPFDRLQNALEIPFVGGDGILGSGYFTKIAPPKVMSWITAMGVPLRLFLPGDSNVDSCSVLTDIQSLRNLWGDQLKIAVEVHNKRPSLQVIAKIAKKTGVGIVLDTLGFHRTGATISEACRTIAEYIIAIQVKGFIDTKHEGISHCVLDDNNENFYWTVELIRKMPNVPILVETKAGCHWQDRAALQKYFNNT